MCCHARFTPKKTSFQPSQLFDSPTCNLSRHTLVHWGYFSKIEAPVLTIDSGDEVIVEMATHHACDDWDKMIKGDEGMESIYTWNSDTKNEAYRGATGGGDGVHILTGPIFVNDAEPGDILKVEILDLKPRKNADGKVFGSNAAAWWGFQARVPQVDGSKFDAGDFTDSGGVSTDEVVTIYEIIEDDVDGASMSYAIPSYQFMWPTITDPEGVERNYIAYPGTCVPHDAHGTFCVKPYNEIWIFVFRQSHIYPKSRLTTNCHHSFHIAGDTTISEDITGLGWTKAAPIQYFDNPYPAKIPINYHIGCMGLPPASHDFVDSIPPMVTGGNLDNKRIGIGTTMYYPIQVEGALLSMGDAHSAQADSELDGTGIETSVTATIKVSVIKAVDFTDWQAALDFPLGETATEWIVHGFTETDYLKTYFDNPADIYGASNLDNAMKNAFIQTRKFVMSAYGLTEMEAVSVITQGIDFGITQLVDGNWGVRKYLAMDGSV